MKHIDAAIGMSAPIGDKAAIVFAVNFYGALVSGRSVKSAYEQAIAMMVVEGTGDEDIPRFFQRRGTSSSDLVFAQEGDVLRGPSLITIVLNAELDDLDPQKMGQLIGELRKQSGDIRLEIGRRARGSVRLSIHTTVDGAERLRALHSSGKLSELRGYAVQSIEYEEMVEARETSLVGSGPEFREVEEPFLDQLVSMGWKVISGSTVFPSVTGRETFREVLIRDDVVKALRRINLRDGQRWLDDARISSAIGAIERLSHARLMEANQAGTRLLLNGVGVEGMPDWEQGRDRTLQFIDWDNPENNTFTAISQFKVDCPGGMSKGSIRPDVTLFINGIPVVVVECKSPTSSEPIPSAIDQLRRYHNARKESGEVDDAEGAERLFHTNQFLIATSYDEARVGTIGAEAVHYLEWKDTAPVPLSDVQGELGKQKLSSQNKLIAGMLRKEHLLDIIRHFTIYQQVDGRTVKVVARYQQFRAVHAAVERLLTGKTRKQDGEHDRRGGIVWHTQGSGKSLTMVFLVRKMRSMVALRRFKVPIVTDRKDLQRQLSGTAGLIGESIRVAGSVSEAKQLLARKGPEIVFVTIQKYRDRDVEKSGPEAQTSRVFGLLNDDESILVLVDEAHRSHSNNLHASLLQALPNCARIGFTGTPIIMGAKRSAPTRSSASSSTATPSRNRRRMAPPCRFSTRAATRRERSRTGPAWTRRWRICSPI